jgi:uncharacterized protein (TIGR00255 family)
MTGFARVERQYDFGRLSWEMRSVNHRYLEFGLRLPEEFRPLEADIRNCLGGYLSRGKIDATLRLTESSGATGSGIHSGPNFSIYFLTLTLRAVFLLLM